MEKAKYIIEAQHCYIVFAALYEEKRKKVYSPMRGGVYVVGMAYIL